MGRGDDLEDMYEEESRGYLTTSKESSTNNGPPSGEIGGLPTFRYDEDVLNKNRHDITVFISHSWSAFVGLLIC